ncbi:MAG: hypothetical protein ABIL68_05905 [bacterium]
MQAVVGDIYGNGEECEEEEVRFRVSDVGKRKMAHTMQNEA